MDPEVYKYLKQQILHKNITNLEEGILRAKQRSLWKPEALNEEESGISMSLMHYAVNCIDAITILNNNGISLDIRASNGITPLVYAVNNINIDAVKKFIDLGADINLPYMGFPPFVIAVNNQYCEEIALYLLEKGANKFELSDSTEELIKIAINSNKPKLASKFINQQNETFLPNGHDGIFNLAVEKLFDETIGADICTVRDLFIRYINFQLLHSRNTIFWEVAKNIANQENESLKEKIASGQLLRNNTKSDGFSLVTFAAIFNNINAFLNEEINEPLIEWSQDDIGYKDIFNKTPLEWARIGKSERIADALESFITDAKYEELKPFWIGDQVEAHKVIETDVAIAAGREESVSGDSSVSSERLEEARGRRNIGKREPSSKSMHTVIVDEYRAAPLDEANENTSLIGSQFSDDDCCCCTCCVIQ